MVSMHDYKKQQMVALPRHDTIRPLLGLLCWVHRYYDILLEYQIFHNWDTYETKNFDMTIIASH